MPEMRSKPLSSVAVMSSLFLVLGLVILGFPETVLAKTGNLPWETPLNTLKESLTGPVALAISILGIAVTGGMLVWGGELNEFARRVCMLILAVSFLVGGAGIMGAFFPEAAGAVPVQFEELVAKRE